MGCGIGHPWGALGCSVGMETRPRWVNDKKWNSHSETIDKHRRTCNRTENDEAPWMQMDELLRDTEIQASFTSPSAAYDDAISDL
ncbi:hypothetical protein HRG_012227 [Hirsutella rhossiliensis]